MRDRNRWCVSAVFALPFLPPLERLRAVAHALQQRHDALRMRWVAGLNGMAQQSGQTQEPIVRIVQGASSDADIQERRSEEHTSELQSLMRISYAVFCLKKKKRNINNKQRMEREN